MKKISLFSDGSSLGNPGPGGWAVILRFGEHEKELVGGKEQTTNNQMELTAVIEGLKALKEPCEVYIFSDSSYVVNSINQWLENWIKKDFNKVKNVSLWKEYIKISSKHKIKASWLKAHVGHPENERCDTLARNFAEQIKKGKTT